MGILIPYFRSSSLGCHSFCEMQYYQIYGLGYQNASGLKAVLGTCTHRVMEILGKCKKILQDGDKQSFIDDAIGLVKFTKKGLHTDKFVDDLIRRSYDYYGASHPELDFNKPKFSEKVDDETIKDTFKFVEKLVYVGLKNWKKEYDPRTSNVLAIEKHFDLPIEKDWAHFEHEGKKMQLSIKGTIDSVMLPDSNTIEVVDYKSGQRKDFATGEVKDYAKLQKDPQLLLYNHALSRLYPEVENRVMTILFLRDGGPFSMMYGKEDDEMFLEHLRKKFEEISNTKKPRPVSSARNSWKCKYVCEFSKIDPETGKMKCKHVEDTIKTYGIDAATKKLKKPGFKVDYYESPG